MKDNPDEFKEKLKNIWEPMVDVQLVSELILNKACKSASQEQIYRFQERTKKLLLDTYVSTLLEFKDYEDFLQMLKLRLIRIKPLRLK